MNIIGNTPQFNNSQMRTSNTLKNRNDVQFKGAGTSALKFLADEPVWGATIIDLGSMVIPRTAIDMHKRGFNAGFETGFRESESSANDTCVGLYGVGAGAMIANGINNRYGVQAQKIFASTDAVEVLSDKWTKHNGNIEEYTKDIVNNLEGYNPNSAKADANGFVRIPEEHKEGILNDLKYLATGSRDGMKERWNEVHKRLNANILEATGAEKDIRISHKINGVESSTVSNSNTFLENFYHLTNSLKSDKVQGKTSEFVNSFKKFGKSRTALGLLIAGFFAVAAQPFNVYLSKKRTGKDEFVGAEGSTKNNSIGFKIKKAVSGLGMIAIALGTMGALAKDPRKIPKLFLEKNQYKGKNPTINQFKTVYGLAITSRLLSARNDDEHREVVTKDVLGYFNWLMLGDVVNKLIIKKFQPKDEPLLKKPMTTQNNVIYNNIGKTGRKIVDFLTSSIATHGEVIAEGLKKERPEIKSLLKPNGKTMKFNEILNELPKNGKARKNIKLLNIAQMAGYAYSALVLGIGIPNLNIALTKRATKKRKEKAALVGQQPTQTQNNSYKKQLVFKSSSVFNQMKQG